MAKKRFVPTVDTQRYGKIEVDINPNKLEEYIEILRVNLEIAKFGRAVKYADGRTVPIIEFYEEQLSSAEMLLELRREGKFVGPVDADDLWR